MPKMVKKMMKTVKKMTVKKLRMTSVFQRLQHRATAGDCERNGTYPGLPIFASSHHQKRGVLILLLALQMARAHESMAQNEPVMDRTQQVGTHPPSFDKLRQTDAN